ncbi:MAG: DUF4124 domain-containing protein [Proteobacteria bacterium]|nr:DUF4124 domain-containing protein [Pseudomonadota bacterium]
MHDFERTPRPLRWHEWLILLLLAAWSAGAHAEIYRCTGMDGAAAFQDRPCAANAVQSTVVLAPMPVPAPSPAHAGGRETSVNRAGRSARVPVAATRRRSDGSDGAAYECRTSDGQVFYRHSACPRSVAAVEQGTRTRGHGAKAASGKSIAVTSTRIPREQACYELRRAGAAGRRGREHDQDVSTYEKNLGHDPCR